MQKQRVGPLDPIIPGIENLSKGVVSDPIADLLVCLRQTEASVVYTQASKLKRGILEVLREEGFIRSFSEISYRCAYHSGARARSVLSERVLTEEAKEISNRRLEQREQRVDFSKENGLKKANRSKLPFSFFPLVRWRRHTISCLRRNRPGYRRKKHLWRKKNPVYTNKWKLIRGGSFRSASSSYGSYYRKNVGGYKGKQWEKRSPGPGFGSGPGFQAKKGFQGKNGSVFKGKQNLPAQFPSKKPIFDPRNWSKNASNGSVNASNGTSNASKGGFAVQRGNRAPSSGGLNHSSGGLNHSSGDVNRSSGSLNRSSGSLNRSSGGLNPSSKGGSSKRSFATSNYGKAVSGVPLRKALSSSRLREALLSDKGRYSLACYEYMKSMRVVPPTTEDKRGSKSGSRSPMAMHRASTASRRAALVSGRPLSLAPWKASYLAEELHAAEMRKPHWVRFRKPTPYNDLPYDYTELGPLHLKVPYAKLRQLSLEKVGKAKKADKDLSSSSAVIATATAESVSLPGKKKVGYFAIQLMRNGIRSTKRISRPGARVYASSAEVRSFFTSNARSFGYHSRVVAQSGLGCVILSTNRGLLSYRRAALLGVGGEVLCAVS
jgi:ribosomal protein S8